MKTTGKIFRKGLFFTFNLLFITQLSSAQYPPCTSPPTVSGDVTEISCFNDNNGAINLSVSGGITSFTTGNLVSNNYMWTNGTPVDLGTTYTVASVTVTAKANTTAISAADFRLLDNSNNQVFDFAVFPSNYGYSSGTFTPETPVEVSRLMLYSWWNPATAISLTFTSPTGYRYIWSNSATTEDIANLSEGNYSVTVTDAINCQVSTNFYVEVLDNSPPLINPFYPKTAQEIATKFPSLPDGEYTLYLNGDPSKPFKAYCSDMLGTPKEYISLVNTGSNQNYSLYFAGGASGPGTTLTTNYTKIRFNPLTLQVDISDSYFSSSTGGVKGLTSMPYGVAADCYEFYSHNGTANVDLRGTSFNVNDTWVVEGYMPNGTSTFTENNQVVNITGGGFCGSNQPTGSHHGSYGFSLDLSYIEPTFGENLEIPLDNITQSTNTGNCSAVVTWATPAFVDNCQATLTSNHNSGDVFPVGTTSVIYTATDASNNSSTSSFDVIVIDDVYPTIITQNVEVVLDLNGIATITPQQIDNGSTDNCAIQSLALSQSIFSCEHIGENTVILTVTDVNGNVSSAPATVTVEDQIAPVITCPTNIQVNNTPSQCGANVNFTASVTDNCSTTLTYSHQPNSFFPVGITPVTVTATDAAGNSSNCTFNVEVIDVEHPSISCPFDIVINTQPGVCGAVVNYELPTGNDNCGTEAPPTSIPDHTFKGYHNGHTYFLSNSMVPPETAHANALDAGGYLATIADAQENQFVSNMHPDRIWIGFTDRDQEGVWRWITNEPVNYTNWSAGEPNNAGNEDWAVINWSGPTWNDWYYTQPAYYVIEFGGGGIPANLVAGLESGSVFPVGSTEVTYEVLDPSGNRVECTFNVTVNDNQAPVAVAQNLELQLDQNGQATLTAAQVDNGSSDNCEIASMVLSKTNFDCSNLGNNPVTLTVTDVNGNSASTQAVITIVDKIAPTISCAADIVSYDTSIPEE